MEMNYKQHMDNLCNSVKLSGGDLQGCSIFMNPATLAELGLEACNGNNELETDDGQRFEIQHPLHYKFEGKNLRYCKDESLPDKCIVIANPLLKDK